MSNVFNKNWTSDYIFHEDINCVPDHKRNVNLSKPQIIDKYDEGVISVSDLYIVYVIHVMTFANQYQIWEYIKWWGKHNNEIPLISSDNMENFGNRLEALCKNSFIRRYKFKNIEGKHRDYFYVTANGYNFLKRKLYFKGSYDEFLGAAPLQEVLKYLSNNEILIQILKKTNVEHGYHLESKPVFSSHVQFFDKLVRENITTYGFFIIRKEDSKHKILLEPFRPTFDKNHYSKSHMDAVQEGRFAFIKRYVADYIKVNNDPSGLSIIYVAENMEAAKQLATTIATFDNYMRNMIYISVDKTIETAGLTDTFLQLREKNGKPILSAATLEV